MSEQADTQKLTEHVIKFPQPIAQVLAFWPLPRETTKLNFADDCLRSIIFSYWLVDFRPSLSPMSKRAREEDDEADVNQHVKVVFHPIIPLTPQLLVEDGINNCYLPGPQSKAVQLRTKYHSQTPFKHLALPNFLNETLCRKVHIFEFSISLTDRSGKKYYQRNVSQKITICIYSIKPKMPSTRPR